MEAFAQLIPLIIIIPAVGAFINMFLGARLGERISGAVGIGAALLSFVVAVLIFIFVNNYHGGNVIVNPPFVDGWIAIESIGLIIPWQFRVDGLSATMMLVITGIGSLIHIYSYGYMRGDPKFSRFFVFLNLFFVFMLLLVTANNYVMMFVGWEGVGLCSYLLISYYWDKKHGKGWRSANAARKAVIVNRIGDLGLIISMFLIFWTFGTFDYYRPGETANVPYTLQALGLDEEAAEAGAAADEAHGAAAAPPVAISEVDNSRFTDWRQLGVFGQTMHLGNLEVGHPDRMIDLGPFTLEFGQVMFLIVIFMVVGVTAKSAQIPLFVWLPDAMAGPTPVSALMHAATMVTAGVFLLVRSNVFIDYAPEAAAIIALIGGATALLGGFIGLGQWDIKRVLAYSTVSQLGFMVAAVGLQAYVPAMFHLVTHAIFKACLFLGSGSVIHGVDHGHHHAHSHGHDDPSHPQGQHAGDDHTRPDEAFDPQDMRNMGGLWKRMPITFWTYLFATFAVAGLFPFSGFWSKDEILVYGWYNGFDLGNPIGFIVLGMLLVAAGFTAFYMWRQVQMIFFGEPRTEAAANAPESVAWMTVPLIVLAVGSLVGGFINLPEPVNGIFPPHAFGTLIEGVIPSVTVKGYLMFNLPLALVATAVAFAGIFFAHSLYAGNKAVRGTGDPTQRRDPLTYAPSSRPIWRFAHARMYWDEVYFRLFENPYNRIAQLLYRIDWDLLHDYFHDTVLYKGYKTVGGLLARGVDLKIIDATVLGVGRLTRAASTRLRPLQTGYVRTYAVALLLGVVAVVVVMLLPLIQNS